MIVSAYRISERGRFDYVAFCKALERFGRRSRQSLAKTKKPRGNQRSSRSPQREARPPSPQKRRLEKQKARDGAVSVSESDAVTISAKPKIRVDKRLEAQRILTQSIRKKLLRGVLGAKSDGFLGVQDALFNLDEDGEGFLDERVFLDSFLTRLKSPLTRAETEFLLTNIRMRGMAESSDVAARRHGKEKRAKNHRIDYEQMGVLCNLDSDASFSSGSDADSDIVGNGGGNATSAKIGGRTASSSNLGADFLVAEKRVQAFLCQQQLQDPASCDTTDTPRSAITGAEVFLELAEATDATKSGCICEEDFHRILTKCGVEIAPALLGSILSRFPRAKHDGLISYTSFLQRYGQNPQHSRERRKLKRFLLGLLPLTIPSARTEWTEFLRRRFEKYDAKLHKVKRGELPEREFLHVLHGRTGPLKLSAEQAIQVLTLFLAISLASTPMTIRYPEFVRYTNDAAHALDDPS
ncbi:hypothetical protein PybrP1_009416 [[Pythium] brassicae (nom. inval.)]|nr:hypothetical protein PybrP1_009416 [[Pythium] brassicae (nom. inval.)]